MNGFSSARILVVCLDLALLVAGAASARGDAIAPFTITDLGEGNIAPSQDAGGGWVVVSADGTSTYPFQPTNTYLENPWPIVKTLPPFQNAPVWATMTYGNPDNAYSRVQGPAFLNNHGLFASTDVYGVAGHIQAAGSNVFTALRQPDGSYSLSGAFWSWRDNYSSGGQVAQVLGLNNLDQVLGVTSGDSFALGSRKFLLADLARKTSVDLQTILPNWHLEGNLSLDDEGRLLVTASSEATRWRTHTMLLTPAGLSSAPMPVPEPTTLATLAAALGALAIRRRLAG